MKRTARRLLLSTAALIALGLAPALAQGADPNQPNGAPPAQQGASPATPEGVKPTQDQSGSSNVPATADQQQQGQQAVSTPSGKTGKEEPSAHAPSESTAVFVDGKLNVPGAPADSQTVPAKFSERNDKIDKLPIMAMPLGLSDEQRRAILDSVKQANPPVQTTSAKPAEELPLNIEVHDLGVASDIPDAARLKVVRTPDRILLIAPSNRIVVGEIANK
ncbi:MAG: hypothetical protein K2Z80_34740 [Xanthobacteraceae bacterium]|nr:hypothetical protein [Xanthobacteraceae bacterium]